MEPWLSRGVRSVSVGNYILFYLVNDADAEALITRIAYGRRNMKKVLLYFSIFTHDEITSRVHYRTPERGQVLAIQPHPGPQGGSRLGP